MNDQDKITRILQLISNNDSEREHFFQRLANAKNPAEWLMSLKERGYLDPSKNPPPIELKESKGYRIPHWEVLDFLLNVARNNNKAPNINVTNELVSFIDSVIDYNETKGIDNYRTDWMLLRILFLLPFEKIKVSHLEYLHNALNSKWDNTLIVDVLKEKIIPILIENHPKSHSYLILVMEYFWQYREPSVKYLNDEYTSIIADYWLQEIMDKYRKAISERLKINGVNIAEQLIREIITKDKSQFNLIWIPHIEDNEQNKFPDRYEIQLTFFIRDCLIESDLGDLRDRIQTYIMEDHPIFRRLAIHCINKRYAELKDILWVIKDNPLEYHTIKHELFPLLKNHAKELSTEELKKIIKWIENRDFSYLDLDDKTKKNKEAIIAYKKKEWLSSLLDSHSSEIEALFNKYNALNASPLDHPGLDYWMGDVEVGGREVDVPKGFCEKSNEEIAAFYKLKTADDSKLSYSLMEDYAESLKECIYNNPEKYLDNLKPFQNLHLIYQYELIRAYYSLWQKNQKFEWNNLLEFIFVLVNNLDYSYEYEENDFAYRDWVIGAIANLIEEGTKEDNHAFDPDLLPLTKKILLYIEERTISNSHYSLDLATTILNSTRGKIYAAIINYALRYARLLPKEKLKRFDADILNLFNNRLDEKKEEEFFYSLGKYISNLLYLDREWFFQNFNKIFNKETEELWHFAISGFLFYGTTIYQEIYFKLKETNHLQKAIDTNFSDRHLNARVIQYVCISYLNKWELLTEKNALLNLVIEKSDRSQLKEVIHFMGTQRKFIDEKGLKKEMQELLLRVFNVIQKFSDEKIKNDLLSDLTRWIIFFEELDLKPYNAFLEISKHSSDHFNTVKFVEGLSQIVEYSPNEVANLLLSIIEHDEKYPYYKEEVIKKILDELKKNNLEKEIKMICNMLVKKGLHIYADVLKNYASKENSNSK